MERTDQNHYQSQEAQQLLAQFPNCEQILLLAKDLGADTLTIHRSSTI